MPTLRSASALDFSSKSTSPATSTTGATPRHRRSSSSDSSSSSELITYATSPDSDTLKPQAPTTRQKVDRRPPSTFVSLALLRNLALVTRTESLITVYQLSTVPQVILAAVVGREALQPRDVPNVDARTQGREPRSWTCTNPEHRQGEHLCHHSWHGTHHHPVSCLRSVPWYVQQAFVAVDDSTSGVSSPDRPKLTDEFSLRPRRLSVAIVHRLPLLCLCVYGIRPASDGSSEP